jgi:hypothetical protein
MRKKHIVIVALAAVVWVGCAEEVVERAEPIDPVSSAEIVLTSTAGSAPPKAMPVEAPKPANVDEKPKPDEVSFEPSVESVGGIAIQRLVTASEIDKREPVDPTSSFGPHHDRVYAFVEVSNDAESEKSLFVHFIGPNGKVSGGIELEIPASVPRWRTWAYTRHFDAPGLWRVEVRDAEGSLLGALPFEVEAGL